MFFRDSTCTPIGFPNVEIHFDRSITDLGRGDKLFRMTATSAAPAAAYQLCINSNVFVDASNYVSNFMTAGNDFHFSVRAVTSGGLLGEMEVIGHSKNCEGFGMQRTSSPPMFTTPASFEINVGCDTVETPLAALQYHGDARESWPGVRITCKPTDQAGMFIEAMCPMRGSGYLLGASAYWSQSASNSPYQICTVGPYELKYIGYLITGWAPMSVYQTCLSGLTTSSDLLPDNLGAYVLKLSVGTGDGDNTVNVDFVVKPCTGIPTLARQIAYIGTGTEYPLCPRPKPFFSKFVLVPGPGDDGRTPATTALLSGMTVRCSSCTNATISARPTFATAETAKVTWITAIGRTGPKQTCRIGGRLIAVLASMSNGLNNPTMDFSLPANGWATADDMQECLHAMDLTFAGTPTRRYPVSFTVTSGLVLPNDTVVLRSTQVPMTWEFPETCPTPSPVPTATPSSAAPLPSVSPLSPTDGPDNHGFGSKTSSAFGGVDTTSPEFIGGVAAGSVVAAVVAVAAIGAVVLNRRHSSSCKRTTANQTRSGASSSSSALPAATGVTTSGATDIILRDQGSTPSQAAAGADVHFRSPRAVRAAAPGR
jgi:hypothetical protein